MARFLQPSRIALFASLLFVRSFAQGAIVVLSGGGGVVAIDDMGIFGESVSWNQPVVNELSVQFRELYAAATFDFHSGQEDLGLSFDGVHSVRRTEQESRSVMEAAVRGGFWLSSDVDLQITISGTMSFSLHGLEDPGAGMFFEIANQNQDTIYRVSANSNYGPPEGTILLIDSIRLNHETQYFLNI